MKRPRGIYRFKSVRVLMPLIAILGLLTVPVECAMVHGPHSIFTPPAALAAVQHPHEQSPPVNAASRPNPGAVYAAEFFTPNQDHNLAVAPSPPLASMPPLLFSAAAAFPSRSLFISAATIAALEAVLADIESVEDVKQGPRVVPLAATSSAPGVPATLNHLDSRLSLLPANIHSWLALILPRGRLLPSPEPPPP